MGLITRTCSLFGFALGLSACIHTVPIYPSMAHSPASGEYLSARLAARENDIDKAGAAFGRLAGAFADDPVLVRQAMFYRLASGDIPSALAYAEYILEQNATPQIAAPDDDAAGEEGDLPVAEPSDDQQSDALAHLVVAAGAFKRDDYLAVDAALDFDANTPLIASVVHILKAWNTFGKAGATAGLAALDIGSSDLFIGFHPTHQALMAEQSGYTRLALGAHENSAFGLGGPVGRRAYGAFLERSSDEATTRQYYELISTQPGPDGKVARYGLQRLDRGEKSDAFSQVTPAEGAAIAFYAFAAFIVEEFAAQREKAAALGANVGPPRYNFPLSLAQMSIYLDPELDEARRLAGIIYNLYGDHSSARAILAEIDASSPHYEQARVEIAAGLSAEEQYDEAFAVLRKTIARDPFANEARFAMANIASRQENHARAVSLLSDLIGRLGEQPVQSDWRYFIARGDALMQMDRWQDAEADLKKAVDLAPDEPTALNYLGYSWAERGINLQDAFALIEQAVKADPTSGAIIDSLGWAYYQTGDYHEAVLHLEQAASLEPADVTVTEHLGDVYWRLDRRIEARYQWERALELMPGDKQANKIRLKLANGMDRENSVTMPGK